MKGFTPAFLAEVRRAAGLTQQELADVLGVARNTVVRWENGRRRPTGLPFAALSQWLTRASQAGSRGP